jgi:hypothetical protein
MGIFQPAMFLGDPYEVSAKSEGAPPKGNPRNEIGVYLAPKYGLMVLLNHHPPPQKKKQKPYQIGYRQMLGCWGQPTGVNFIPFDILSHYPSYII